MHLEFERGYFKIFNKTFTDTPVCLFKLWAWCLPLTARTYYLLTIALKASGPVEPAK